MRRVTICKMFAGILASLATNGKFVALAGERSSGSSATRVLLQQPLQNVPGKAITLIHVQYGPGGSTPPHRHPGFTLGYVLDGRIVSQVAAGPQHTYVAGSFFVEQPNDVHRVSRNASSSHSASLLAFLIADVDAKLVQPVSLRNG